MLSPLQSSCSFHVQNLQVSTKEAGYHMSTWDVRFLENRPNRKYRCWTRDRQLSEWSWSLHRSASASLVAGEWPIILTAKQNVVVDVGYKAGCWNCLSVQPTQPSNHFPQSPSSPSGCCRPSVSSLLGLANEPPHAWAMFFPAPRIPTNFHNTKLH